MFLVTAIRKMFQMTTIHSLIDEFICGKRNLEEIRAFLEGNPSSINDRSEEGYTPLSYMVSSKDCDIDIVRLLLEYGANANERDPSGYSPLSNVLSYSPSIHIIRLLFEFGADVNGRDSSEDTETPLHTGLIFRNTDIAVIRLLIDKGADVNALTVSGFTPFCNALNSSYSIDVLSLLLNAGCDPNACVEHASALECASFIGGLKEGVLEMLIEAGADLLGFGRDGGSPVCYALRAGAGVRDIHRLLKLGASLDKCREHNSLWLCATDCLLTEETRRLMSKVNLSWEMPLKAEVVELLRTRNAPVDRVNSNGYTSLQLALSDCKYEAKAIKLLLDLPGVDVTVKDRYNNNLLHLAVNSSHCKQSVVKYLIDRGVKTDEVNGIFQTPLMAAIIGSCNRYVISLLLNNGSPVNAEAFGETVLKIAIMHKSSKDIIQLLLSAGARIGGANGDDSPLSNAIYRFLLNDHQETLDSLLLLVKLYLLENPYFDNEKVIQKLRTYGSIFCAEMTFFVSMCSREVRIMRSKILCLHRSPFCFVNGRSSFVTIVPGNYPSLSNEDFNQLLGVMSQNAFPQYFEIIADKIGKSALKIKLQELQIYAIKRYTDLPCKREIYLNYNSVCEITQFFSAADLLRLILAFYVCN